MAMNEEAETIYAGMQAMAKGKAIIKSSKAPTRIKWAALVCVYYPASDRFAWFTERGSSANNTKVLTKRMVISLINIELGEGDEQP